MGVFVHSESIHGECTSGGRWGSVRQRSGRKRHFCGETVGGESRGWELWSGLHCPRSCLYNGEMGIQVLRGQKCTWQ